MYFHFEATYGVGLQGLGPLNWTILVYWIMGLKTVNVLDET